jgi:membrane fusion protein (multidrug efflux system)
MTWKDLFNLGGGALLATSLAACGGSSGPPAPAAAATTTPRPAQAGEKHAKEPGADAISVRVAPVARQALSSLYSTSASLRAEQQATITARTRGVIQKLLVEEGDQVTAGQALAELDNEEQRIAVSRARTTHDTLRRDLERSETLYKEGLLSDDAVEEVRRDAGDAQQAVALADLELSRTIITAPFEGVIVRRFLDVGATVADGTEVYDLADLSPLFADVDVPERHVITLSPGQRVRLTADAAARIIPATIQRIAPAVDPDTGTVKVTLAVSGEAGIRPGAFVRVDIVVDTHEDAMVVPRLALVAEGSRWHLFRMNEDDTVEQVDVELGFEEGDQVEILQVLTADATLTPGTPIVVAGAPALTDGATVQVVEDESDGDSGVAR